jgi:hypothetical protein
MTAPDKHSQFLERKAETKAPLIPVIHLTGFTFSEMRASLIPSLDRWEEISREKHLYTPEEQAKAEAQAVNALLLQRLCNLGAYEGEPEFDTELKELRALVVAIRTREKDTLEKCYPVQKK